MATKLIGKGAFTKAYLDTDTGLVHLDTTDPVKECMALGMFPHSGLFPLVWYDSEDRCTMHHYDRPRSIKNNVTEADWELYKELRALPTHLGNPDEAYFHWYDCFSQLSNKEASRDLIEALDSLSNYGSDVYFEISPRNVAVSDGRLILLDCFFMHSELLRVRGK